MRTKVSNNCILIASFLVVPVLIINNPISISGVAPAWSIMWLLPWSIEVGARRGFLSGICLGCLIDSISLAGISSIPGLMILGFLWGKLGSKSVRVERLSTIALNAFAGSSFLSLSIWIQQLLILEKRVNYEFFSSSLHIFTAQTIATCLIAPWICSIFLMKLRKLL